MCEKLRYCNPRIDSCLQYTIELINAMGLYRTLASCCGHSEYPETIVVMEKKTKLVKEYHTQVYLSKGKRKRNRYYKKDDRGFYYIPELGSMNQTVREVINP